MVLRLRGPFASGEGVVIAMHFCFVRGQREWTTQQSEMSVKGTSGGMEAKWYVCTAEVITMRRVLHAHCSVRQHAKNAGNVWRTHEEVVRDASRHERLACARCRVELEERVG